LFLLLQPFLLHVVMTQGRLELVGQVGLRLQREVIAQDHLIPLGQAALQQVELDKAERDSDRAGFVYKDFSIGKARSYTYKHVF